VLAITGANDVQVDAADLAVIADLVPAGADIRRVPGLTHVLRRADGPVSPLAYGRLLREPVDAALLDEVAHWLSTHLR
jgi:uncharacterized protein